MFKLSLSSSACCLLPLVSLSSLAHASSLSQESETDLESIVVTAAGREQLLSQAPASITVIDREQIERRFYKDITDALRDIPGATLTRGGSRQDLSLRGMPGQYTAVLVDGKKQTGRETQPSGSGASFEQDWLPPLDAIDRIEVVRGPMATLYGSDAIGGVINIITKKDYQTWQGSVRFETTVQEDSDAGDHSQGQVFLAGPLIDGLLTMSVSALIQDRDEDNIERGYGGKELENYRAEFHLTPTKNDSLTLDISKQDQERYSNSGVSLPSRSSSTTSNNDRTSVSLSHTGNYDWTSSTSFIQRERVENVGREITAENTIFTTQWTFAFNDNTVVSGIAYEKEQVEDFSNLAAASQIENTQWSLFADNEWAALDDLSITIGLRVDDNDVFDLHASPRVYGVWTISDAWIIKGGVSTGYRSPNLRAMAPRWIQESRGGNIHGNAELSPETSVNSEIGIYFTSSSNLVASITGFYNDFDDKINLSACAIELCAEENARQYVNIDKAVTSGVELMVNADLTENLSMNAAYTYTDSEQKSGADKGLPLTQVPQSIATINVDWTITETINTWLRATYRGKDSQPITTGSRSVVAPSVTFADIGANWKVFTNTILSVGVYNLFDKEVLYDEYGYKEDGRRFWLAANINF